MRWPLVHLDQARTWFSIHPKMSLLSGIHQSLEFLCLQNPSASPFEQPFPVFVVLGVRVLQCAEPFPAPDECLLVLV